MGAQIRVYRQRIRSVSATKKITRAMELMAASRVVKARTAVLATTGGWGLAQLAAFLIDRRTGSARE